MSSSRKSNAKAKALWKKAAMLTQAQLQMGKAIIPGRVYSWGMNEFGQLGHGNKFNMDRPKLMEEFRGMVIESVGVGSEHALACTDSGEIFAWGNNGYSQLGLGDDDDAQNVPRRIEYLTGRIIKFVACGEFHSLAVTERGEVYAWGCGEQGQLGLGDVSNQRTPRAIDALKGKRIISVACGAGHSAFVDDAGSMYICGWGEYGQLGLGDTGNQLSPRWVEILHGKRVLQVACGEVHTLALTANGEVFSWGHGEDGRLGHSLYGKCLFPTLVTSLQGKMIVRIAAGDDFSAALTDTGEVWVWGHGLEGQLGNGTLRNTSVPVLVSSLKGHHFVLNIDAGFKHLIVATDQGEVLTWGAGPGGSLGLGPEMLATDQPEVIPTIRGRKIVKIAAGGQMCLVVSGEPITLPPNLYAAGDGKSMALGLASQDTKAHLMPVEALQGTKVVHAAAGQTHSVICCEDGSVWTWGIGTAGCLGHGSELNVQKPKQIDFFKAKYKKITQVFAGAQHTFCLTDIGDCYSFGYGYNGELGHGGRDNQLEPLIVKPLEGKGVISVSCGWNFTAVVTDAGDVWTFGNNTYGQLGHGDTEERLIPTQVRGLIGKRMVAVACGRSHMAALSETGDVYTWGFGTNGQLGHGDAKMQNLPRYILSLKGQTISDLCCGSSHTALVTDRGALLTFGFNNSGRLGHGDSNDRMSPELVEEMVSQRTKVLRVFSNCTAFHTYALDDQGRLWSWGFGKSGVLSTGDLNNEKKPVKVLSTGSRIIEHLALGARHTLCVTSPSTIAQRLVRGSTSSASAATAAGAASSSSAAASSGDLSSSQSVLARSKSAYNVGKQMQTLSFASAADNGGGIDGVSAAEMAKLQEQLTISQEKLNRMRQRNSELREELDQVRNVNQKLSGVDLETLPLSELEELKSNFVDNVRKVFNIKQEKLRDEMSVKEKQQVAEIEKVYSDVLVKLQYKVKVIFENIQQLTTQNAKIEEKMNALSKEMARIRKEISIIPQLTQQVAEAAEKVQELEGRRAEVDKREQRVRGELADEIKNREYLEKRVEALTEEHRQINDEVKRANEVLEKRRAKKVREGVINTAINAMLSDRPGEIPKDLTADEVKVLEEFYFSVYQLMNDEVMRRDRKASSAPQESLSRTPSRPGSSGSRPGSAASRRLSSLVGVLSSASSPSPAAAPADPSSPLMSQRSDGSVESVSKKPSKLGSAFLRMQKKQSSLADSSS